MAAQDVLEHLELDLLVVMPAARPPHRQAILEPQTRFELMRRLCADADFEASHDLDCKLSRIDG